MEKSVEEVRKHKMMRLSKPVVSTISQLKKNKRRWYILPMLASDYIADKHLAFYSRKRMVIRKRRAEQIDSLPQVRSYYLP
jgi:hypothetical protein